MTPAARRLLLWSAAAVVLGAAQVPALAQYTWRDAKGQLHASDQPPPRDVPEKDIIRRPVARPATTAATPPAALAAPGSSAPAAAATPAAPRPADAGVPVDRELQQRRARAEQEAKAKAQAEEQRLAVQRAGNCQRARNQLATLDSGMRLARVNERGERIVLDDEARAREAAQARSVIASDCR